MKRLIKAIKLWLEEPDKDIKDFLQTEYKGNWYWAYRYYKERGTFPNQSSIRI